MFLNVGESPALLTGCKSQPSIDAASLSLFRYFGHFPSHLSLDIGMRPLKSPRVSKLMSTGAYSEKPGEMVEMDLDMFGSLRLPKPKLNRDPLDSRRVRAKAPLWLFWWLVSSDSGSLGKSKKWDLVEKTSEYDEDVHCASKKMLSSSSSVSLFVVMCCSPLQP